ncbi:MAG: hypothetical protein KAS69_03090 [Planctomycetes bacterium]|nr:hypothetical protein [Planctomycetota bacterium]
MQKKIKSKINLYISALIICMFAFCTVPVLAEIPDANQQQTSGEQNKTQKTTSSSQRLISSSAGENFYEIAYELANSKDISPEKIKLALTLMTATIKIDNRADYVLPEMIKLACKYSQNNNLGLVSYLLQNYIDNKSDIEVVRTAIGYLIDQLDSREEREKLLRDTLDMFEGKSNVIDSEIYTLLGLLAAESVDLKTAQSYFLQAYSSNKYNKMAFVKLLELASEQVNPVMKLEHLRLSLGENPLDMKTALDFAQYARQIQLYKTSAKCYKYCADLFSYLYQQPLPDSIYLPWASSNYNTQRSQNKCLEISEQIRSSGRFDIQLETIAAKAAAKIGRVEQSEQMFRNIEEKINAYSEQNTGEQLSAIAWFYCFGLPDSAKSLDWANKAYSSNPSSQTAAALLAYALATNGQLDLSEQLIGSYNENQISLLATAVIKSARDEKESVIEILKSAIGYEPGSLEAEYAQKMLFENGGEYIAPVEHDIVLIALENSFGRRVVPEFASPDKIISAQLNVRGSKFPYGTGFGATLAITNLSQEPLVISRDGLFGGNIRIDAHVRGDIQKDIPNLISIKVCPSQPLKQSKSIIIPLRLMTGELKKILLTYPQASLDIEFVAYLDAVEDSDGKPANRLPDVKPASIIAKRPAVQITGKYLRNRFTSLSKSWQGQKTKTIELFIGLLMEQYALANRQPLYKFRYAEWMPALLKSAVLQSVNSGDWVGRVNIMSSMLPLRLDYDLIEAVSDNLSDEKWPSRFMALYLLAQNQHSNFVEVLDYTAKYDSNKLVRDMAIALGGTGEDGSTQ